MNETILAIDDDTEALSTLETLLLKEGFFVTAVDSGEKAINLIKDNEYNLVLTDLVMRGIDGLTVLDEVKSRYPQTVVIVASEYGVMESVIEALRKRAIDYVMKPYDEEVLLCIRNALERQKKGKAKTILHLCLSCKKVQRLNSDSNNPESWITFETFNKENPYLKIIDDTCPECPSNP